MLNINTDHSIGFLGQAVIVFAQVKHGQWHGEGKVGKLRQVSERLHRNQCGLKYCHLRFHLSCLSHTHTHLSLIHI